MANLTVTVDEDVLKKARLRALEQGTSVNAVVRGFLESYAGTESARQRAVADVLRLARASEATRGRRTWSRDELHER